MSEPMTPLPLVFALLLTVVGHSCSAQWRAPRPSGPPWSQGPPDGPHRGYPGGRLRSLGLARPAASSGPTRPPSRPSGCFHESLQQPGYCELLTKCDYAVRERQRGGRPQLCGFPPSGLVPMACCPTSSGPPDPESTSSSSLPPPQDVDGDSTSTMEPESCERILGSKDSPKPTDTASRTMCRSYARAACELSPPTLKGSAPADGEPAGRLEFPHMALLGFGRGPDNINWACGGSLIAPDWVLTAAHCLAVGSVRVSWVLLGALYRREGDEEVHSSASAPAHRQLLAVAEAVPHPEYVVTGRYHDVALLRLAKPAVTSRHGVRPACLHTDQDGDPTGSEAVATGWGATGFGEDAAEHLTKVNLTIRSLVECAKSINSRTDPKLKHGIQDGQLCAGGGGIQRDTCQGDSGGPLQVPVLPERSGEPSCLYRIIGVVSFGPACGIGLPGVYTRVSHYVPWVEAVVWLGQQPGQQLSRQPGQRLSRQRGQQLSRQRGQRLSQPSRGLGRSLSEAPAGSCSLLLRDNATLRLPITGNGTLARRMCRSYMLDWCSSGGPLAMRPGRTARDECHFTADVGEVADPVDYPHMALLVYGDEYFNEEIGCSASLISPNYLLTAARCASLGCLPLQRALMGIMGGRGSLGAHYRSRDRQDIAVKDVIVHPDYARDRRFNDVALVRLAKPVRVTALVRPVCLQSVLDGSEVGLRATATGWEASGQWFAVDGELRRAALAIRDPTSCTEDLEYGGLDGGLADSQLCVGGFCPNSTYPGEPGAPLQVIHRVLETKDGLKLQMHRLLGVASLSPPCGKGGSCMPDIFSRVAPFVPWIESIVWPTGTDEAVEEPSA